MNGRLRVGLVLLAACPFSALADVSGSYIDEATPSIALVRVENADGTVTGNFEGLSESIALHARRTGNVLEGTIGEGDDVLDLRATIDGETITVVLNEGPDQEVHAFRRTGDAPGARSAAVATTTPQRVAASPSAPPGTARNVTVNGQRLSAEELARLEQTYRVRIVDADYWYDNLNGAWGIKGGPTRGFIYSGLNLGGPLAANASGGGSGVFVNGRELHPLDVSGLERCTQVTPGRYWVGPDGIGGYEGGPASFNLVALCSPPANGGRSGGWLCDGGSCGTARTVTGPYAVTSEGDGRAGVYTDQGLILTPK